MPIGNTKSVVLNVKNTICGNKNNLNTGGMIVTAHYQVTALTQ
jgi:hypothetical protein